MKTKMTEVFINWVLLNYIKKLLKKLNTKV